MQRVFNEWGQVAVMLATAAGLFATAWDQRATLNQVARTVVILEERTRTNQADTERLCGRVDRLEERELLLAKPRVR